MKVNSSQPNLVFILVRDEMMVYISSNNTRKLLTSLIGNCIPAMLTLQQHMMTSIETSSSYLLENLPESESIDLIEEFYWSTKFYT